MHQNGGPGVSVSGAASLAQLMSEHRHKSDASGVVDTRRGLGVLSLSALTIGSNSPPAINQNSLSLGTLASLNMTSASHAPAPSLLSVSLSSLSLSNPKITTSTSSLAAPPPGFGSLSSVLLSNPSSESGGKAATAAPKGSPSLADLIQEHSNRSPTISNSFPTPVTCQGAAAPALSLSGLASRHLQSTDQSAKKPTSSAPAYLGGTLSLSQLAQQHQTFTSPQPASAEPPANALKQPPGFSSLSHLASEHKGETSTTSNGSQYSLTSLLSPAKPEEAGAFAQSTTEGGAKLHRKPYHRNARPPKQTIDLSVLMAQSDGDAGPRHYDNDLPSPSSPASLPASSIFAQPSVFAMTLSLRSRKQQRRTRKGKIKGHKTGSGRQDFLCKSQEESEEQHPLSPIVPFCFDVPSPDDIVHANQRKAFTR